jgi:hypothetical protein
MTSASDRRLSIRGQGEAVVLCREWMALRRFQARPKPHRLEQNTGAAAIELTPDDLRVRSIAPRHRSPSRARGTPIGWSN